MASGSIYVILAAPAVIHVSLRLCSTLVSGNLSSYPNMYIYIDRVLIMKMFIQWNPSKTATIADNYFGATGIFPVGVVLIMWLLSITWLHFQSFPLLYAGREG